MLGSGGGVELVAGVLGQQHDAGLVHVGRQRPQQDQQPGGGEYRDVVHVHLIPWDLDVVDAQHREHRRAERLGELLGFPADGG